MANDLVETGADKAVDIVGAIWHAADTKSVIITATAAASTLMAVAAVTGTRIEAGFGGKNGFFIRLKPKNHVKAQEA